MHVTSLVLDEVDFLLVDEIFGPQLRTVCVAVSSGSGGGNNKDNEGGSEESRNNGAGHSLYSLQLLQLRH